VTLFGITVQRVPHQSNPSGPLMRERVLYGVDILPL